MSQAYPIYVVDDDEAIRRSLSFLLKTSGFAVQLFEGGLPFLKEAGHLAPGCVLLDVRMPDMDGLEVQRALRGRGVMLPVIIMTGHGDVDMAVQAMKAGASDFIEKPFEKAALLACIAAAQRQSVAERGLSARAMEAQARLNVLTDRERDVLNGLVDGLPNKTIAYDLGISPRTVEIHRANLMQKLEVRSLAEALRIAFHAGQGADAPPG
ncbi:MULTISPECIES: response regulator FixJ [Sphingomonadaceae]|jgi:two-component system, LuxR family, response regulator FixJ|uniref:response regulator FixJ n=1 Tax=Sphingomonadales TaxID=204457 RepID=UPI0000D7BEFA|nr:MULTISPECIES: response regulator FixJ [Sphingomonadaceae]MEC9016663.1 response regulator FixJ [Pseudomonadota bacterium]EAT09684.1 two component transcriptional regulator, LuxR family protein [Sphingomonas sp. SKA58]MBS47621.1 DNA-binding response regulator [Sphingobium sp.]MCC4255882.1 response regulator [Sphingobium lactosutens]MEE2740988.1 response regulator FixJ [Pseudomonadota bacterium]|tara:strand:+ start:3260 stop:3889 length:630 start_codon:yes stop_codon:yes gene_type:complete